MGQTSLFIALRTEKVAALQPWDSRPFSRRLLDSLYSCLVYLRVQLKQLMLAGHWEFYQQNLRIFADEDIRRRGLPAWEPEPVLLLGEDVSDVHAADQAGGGVVRRELVSLNSAVHFVKIVELIRFFLCGLFASCVDPEAATVVGVPSPALVQLDPEHQQAGPRLVHRQTCTLVRYFLEGGVLNTSQLVADSLAPGGGRGVFAASIVH